MLDAGSLRTGSEPAPDLVALGEAAFLVTYAPQSAGNSARARAFAEAVRIADMRGVHDIVPAYDTVLVRFDPRIADPEILQRNLMVVASASEPLKPAQSRLIELAVVYGGEAGPDLSDVAAHTGLSPQEVIERHASAIYTVEFLGFSPGFPYLSGLPPELSTPRLPSPRTRVAGGSVGIAGGQTGFYPLPSPGGWRLIGRLVDFTFDPEQPDSLPYAPGDTIRFVPVSDAPHVPRHRTTNGVNQHHGGTLSDRALIIVNSGPHTTVQDAGRFGAMSRGYAQSGALDHAALSLANQLVSNPPGAAALEMAVTGDTLQAVGDHLVALAGANFAPCVDGEPQPNNEAFWLRHGSRLSFGGRVSGARTYCAVSGGIDVPVVLGSRSTDLVAGVGGHRGRLVKSGDTLVVGACIEQGGIGRRTRAARGPRPAPNTLNVRVVWTSECDWFDENSRAILAGQAYTVSPLSDRTGIRLTGTKISLAVSADLRSRGVVPGSIQVPPEGQPIVLLADARTVGGYPTIATVIEPDLSLLAQMWPGQSLCFKPITLAEARRARRDPQVEPSQLEAAPWLETRCVIEARLPRENRWLCPRNLACAVSRRCLAAPFESEHQSGGIGSERRIRLPFEDVDSRSSAPPIISANVRPR